MCGNHEGVFVKSVVMDSGDRSPNGKGQWNSLGKNTFQGSTLAVVRDSDQH